MVSKLNIRHRTHIVHIGTRGREIRFNRRDGYDHSSVGIYQVTAKSKARLIKVLAHHYTGVIEMDYWS